MSAKNSISGVSEESGLGPSPRTRSGSWVRRARLLQRQRSRSEGDADRDADSYALSSSYASHLGSHASSSTWTM